MMPSSELPNPYQPPTTGASSADGAAPAQRHWRGPVRRWFDLLTLAFVALASGAYLAFIGILVNSSSIDRIAGYLFLVNAPLLTAWTIQLWRHRRVSFRYGLVVVAAQLVITLAMISMGIGSFWNVVRINAWITLGFGLLMMQCHGVLRIANASHTQSQMRAERG